MAPSPSPPTPPPCQRRSSKKAPKAPSRSSIPRDSSAQNDSGSDSGTETTMTATAAQWSTGTQWILLAVASGACAAFNGVFAKLTTTKLTTMLAHAVASLLRLSKHQDLVEYIVRAMFFTLNLIFNGVMWSLFTAALARGTSATQVSILNTSTNFLVTALLGIVVFAERLPPLWWAGASLLVVGNVIVGRNNDSGGGGDSDETEPLIPPAAAAVVSVSIADTNDASATDQT